MVFNKERAKKYEIAQTHVSIFPFWYLCDWTERSEIALLQLEVWEITWKAMESLGLVVYHLYWKSRKTMGILPPTF